MTQLAIKAHNLTKVYYLYENPTDRLKESLHPFRKKYHNDFYALNDVSFEVNKGETVGIIGKNGSGKSTLLKIAAGVTTSTYGSVSTYGKVLSLLELGTGFNPEMTGLENIYFYGTLMGAGKNEIDRKIENILAFAEIGDFIYQPVKTYSSGMYVRLGFAVIANMDAEILIIDEALSVGDAFFTQKCMRFLRKFKVNGTIIFVSHDMGAVLNLCHKAIWLDNGKIKEEGTPKYICEKYLEAIFEEQQEIQLDFGSKEQLNQSIVEESYKDQRLDIVNNSRCRNDIEILQFVPDSPSYGKRMAHIIDVRLLNQTEAPLSWVVGGEPVILLVRAVAKMEINDVIVGFFVKDRLGQALFGDTTYLATEGSLRLGEGEVIEAKFEFSMPLLPNGNHSICAAVAEGTLEKHVQHHWVHDALIFRVNATTVSYGLVGLPMHKVSVSVS